MDFPFVCQNSCTIRAPQCSCYFNFFLLAFQSKLKFIHNKSCAPAFVNKTIDAHATRYTNVLSTCDWFRILLISYLLYVDKYFIPLVKLLRAHTNVNPNTIVNLLMDRKFIFRSKGFLHVQVSNIVQLHSGMLNSIKVYAIAFISNNTRHLPHSAMTLALIDYHFNVDTKQLIAFSLGNIFAEAHSLSLSQIARIQLMVRNFHAKPSRTRSWILWVRNE